MGGGIDSLMREWRPAVLVVGLPYNVDDSESAAAARARSFAGELAERYGLPVELVDERYSSMEALDRLKEARASGLRKRRVAKGDVDAAAARDHFGTMVQRKNMRRECVHKPMAPGGCAISSRSTA